MSRNPATWQSVITPTLLNMFTYSDMLQILGRIQVLFLTSVKWSQSNLSNQNHRNLFTLTLSLLSFLIYDFQHQAWLSNFVRWKDFCTAAFTVFDSPHLSCTLPVLFVPVPLLCCSDFQFILVSLACPVITIQREPVSAVSSDINFPMKGRRGMKDWARTAEDKLYIPKEVFTVPTEGRGVNIYVQQTKDYLCFPTGLKQVINSSTSSGFWALSP